MMRVLIQTEKYFRVLFGIKLTNPALSSGYEVSFPLLRFGQLRISAEHLRNIVVKIDSVIKF